MNKKEKELINLIQKEFPLCSRPFKALAERVGLTEEEVLNFLKKLKEEGVLRHLGASINSKKLGYRTCLCAASLPKEKLYLAEEIARLPEVTHAYLRKHSLNFWFTLITPSEEREKELISFLEKTYSIEIKKFPTLKKFKVRAVFEV